MKKSQIRWISLMCVLPILVESTHHHPANSFFKFYGPVVVGNDREIRVGAVRPHSHASQMNSVDYVAQPLYNYAYGVEDYKTGDSHGQKERRDGLTVQGEYHVAEPSGNIRTVRYWADETGFHATVHNSDPKAAAAALPTGPANPEDKSNEKYW